MTVARHVRASGLVFVLALVLMGIAAPSSAHEGHKKKKPVAARLATAPAQPSANVSIESSTAPSQVQLVDDDGEAAVDRSRMTTLERLLDWIGRLHPVIVHFPLAFFPAALFCAIAGRRRPAFAAPAQFLLVAGCIFAPVTAILGWLDAMAADPDPLLTVHRWLGSLIGIASLALGVWAVRRPDRSRSTAMIVALALVTAALVVQGWYGGALVHGADHLDW